MTETHKLPPLATTAINLLTAQYRQDMATIANQTVAVMGLDPALKWTVDSAAGVVRREVPDTPVAPVAPATPEQAVTEGPTGAE